MTTARPRPEPSPARPRPSEERARLADEGRTTRRIAVAALVLALVGAGIAATRFIFPAASSCQQSSWDVRPADADLPDGFTLSVAQYDINRQQVTFLGPAPADSTTAQGVVYVTVTCFDEGAADAVSRSEQAARDANQVVTKRTDLGDGGFAATDENGSSFLQLRHGGVVVYLAASADVTGADVDTLASAYDKALGGDGGAVSAGTLDPGSSVADSPLPSDPPSAEVPSAAAAPGLEARLPTVVDGTTLTVNSVVGTDLFGTDQSSRAIVAALRAAGKTPADLSFAQAFDDSQQLDLSMFAVSVAGLSEAKTKAIVLDAWLAASGAGVSQSTVTMGGKELTKIDYGDNGANDYVLARDGAIIVLTTSDDAVATAAVAALP
ncbi:MAG TPA: hypothetical protein VGK16_13180 [Candidatus Limnocylindrales bacterium]